MRAQAEYQYTCILRNIMEFGDERMDRTGVGTKALFGVDLEADLAEAFPLFCKKKMPWKQTIDELKWFISGSTNCRDLPKRTQHWWSPWADENGELGPVYGRQFRDVGGVDQLADFVEGIVDNPYSRRHIITLWDPSRVDDCALPCCHGTVIQAFVTSSDELHLQMYQRSADMFIGAPVNVASYALFAHLVAAATWTVPKRLRIVFGDAHIYKNHFDQVEEYCRRPYVEAPQVHVADHLRGLGITTLETFTHEDIVVENYNPLPTIEAPLAV